MRSVHHVQVDVGLKQSHTNFAQRLGNVLFGERALAAQSLEGALQFICKGLKHNSSLSVPCA
jgi:hypothetical protein